MTRLEVLYEMLNLAEDERGIMSSALETDMKKFEREELQDEFQKWDSIVAFLRSEIMQGNTRKLRASDGFFLKCNEIIRYIDSKMDSCAELHNATSGDPYDFSTEYYSDYFEWSEIRNAVSNFRSRFM